MSTLPSSARFAQPEATPACKLLLLDVMDTLIADPFFRGFEKARTARARPERR